MRETLEMVTVSLLQNMVQFRKKNIYFATKLFFEILGKVLLGSLGDESPHGGAIWFEWEVISNFERFTDSGIRAGALGMLIAHWLYIFGAIFKAVHKQ